MPTSLDISLPLLPGESYHIYNRGNEKRTIFFQEDNFRYFLKRYHYYVKDFMDTYAYCLLDNHFHLCVKIKSSAAILKAVKTNKAFKPIVIFYSDMPYLIWNLSVLMHRRPRTDMTDHQDLSYLICLRHIPVPFLMI